MLPDERNDRTFCKMTGMVLPITENQEIGRVEQESTDSRCRSRAYQFVGSVGGEHGTVATAGSKA